MSKIKSAKDLFKNWKTFEFNNVVEDEIYVASGNDLKQYADYVLKAKLESITKPQIENLKAQMQGKELNIYQKADALIEFNKLLNYVSKLEQKLLKDE